jgi:hypothetical protein
MKSERPAARFSILGKLKRRAGALIVANGSDDDAISLQ